MSQTVAWSPALPATTERRPSSFVVESTDELNHVTSVWAELEPAGSAFQSRRWLTLWFEHVAPYARARPLFVTVRDRASRQPLILFAFCVRRICGLRVAEFPDLGVSDYNAPLCAPGLRLDGEGLAELWSAVRDTVSDVDLFYFNKVPAALNDRPMAIADLPWLKPIAMRCWAVRLPANRTAYEAGLARKDRKEQKRKRRNLESALGKPMLMEAGSGEQAENIFDLLKSFRAVRFRERGRRDILADHRFAAFYRALVAEWGTFARLAKVRAGDKDIAAFLALRHQQNYVLIMHSFANLEKLSPGIVALDTLISNLIDEKIDYCDFTIGDEPYKLQFGVRSSVMLQGIDAVTWRGRIAAGLLGCYWKLHDALVKGRARALKAAPFLSRLRARTEPKAAAEV